MHKPAKNRFVLVFHEQLFLLPIIVHPRHPDKHWFQPFFDHAKYRLRHVHKGLQDLCWKRAQPCFCCFCFPPGFVSSSMHCAVMLPTSTHTTHLPQMLCNFFIPLVVFSPIYKLFTETWLVEIILLCGTVPGYYPPIFLVNKMGRPQNNFEPSYVWCRFVPRVEGSGAIICAIPLIRFSQFERGRSVFPCPPHTIPTTNSTSGFNPPPLPKLCLESPVQVRFREGKSSGDPGVFSPQERNRERSSRTGICSPQTQYTWQEAISSDCCCFEGIFWIRLPKGSGPPSLRTKHAILSKLAIFPRVCFVFTS